MCDKEVNLRAQPQSAVLCWCRKHNSCSLVASVLLINGFPPSEKNESWQSCSQRSGVCNAALFMLFILEKV